AGRVPCQAMDGAVVEAPSTGEPLTAAPTTVGGGPTGGHPVEQTEEVSWPTALSGWWLRAAQVGLVVVVVLGLVLRFWTRSALWLDEALTVDIARLPIHEIPSYLKRDGA